MFLTCPDFPKEVIMFVRLTVLACIVVSISCYASAQTDSAPQETLSATSAAEAANEKSEQKQPEAAAAALQSVESAAPEDERLPYEVITLRSRQTGQRP
jgi:hypothetical protein